MLCYSMSLRGLKGVQKSKKKKQQNAPIELIRHLNFSNHDKTYAML